MSLRRKVPQLRPPEAAGTAPGGVNKTTILIPLEPAGSAEKTLKSPICHSKDLRIQRALRREGPAPKDGTRFPKPWGGEGPDGPHMR